MDIIINGRKTPIKNNPLTYNRIAILAGYTPDANPSVTFSRGGKEGRDMGCLAHGDTVVVNERTIINCIVTGNA